MIDLDKFKRFNDTYGHQAGDEVLRGVGRVLRRTLSDTDFAARYGGEEFALILSRTTSEDALQTMTQVRQAVERSAFDFNGNTLRITTSIGGSHVQRGDAETAALVQRADEALYVSKNAGRNCVHWHDGRMITRVEPPAIVEAKAEEPKKSEPKKSEAKKPEPKKPELPPAAPLSAELELPDVVDELADTSVDTLNRTAFCQQVRSRIAEWKRGGPTLSLILLEIDQCDHMMSHQGQQVREAVLAELRRLVQAAIREMDLVARYGPNSLAMLLPTARLAEATRVAERLREGVTQLTVPIGEGSLRLTASIGVIEVCESDNIVTLFHRAEKAVAAGHQNGGNCVFHYDGAQCAQVSAMAEA